ncbi:MAG: hypothetical protein AAF684_12030, partial [Pseudomonadota bacterium]
FRELWAIGSRNAEIAGQLTHHYRRLGAVLTRYMHYPARSSAEVSRMAAVLLVVSEGFSIVGPAQMIDHDEATRLFTNLLLSTATDQSADV